jgi:hypothetical protein
VADKSADEAIALFRQNGVDSAVAAFAAGEGRQDQQATGFESGD